MSEIKSGVIEQALEDGTWAELHPVTDASLVNYGETNADAKLTDLENRLETVESGRVNSLNGQTGNVELIGYPNNKLNISAINKKITINADLLATDLELKEDEQNLADHKANKENPHEVTKAQVGLGNCDNTSDLDKPVSTATQTQITRLDAKDTAQDSRMQTIEDNATAEINRAKGVEGDLSNLSTSTKLNLVAAINEINNDVYRKESIKDIALSGEAEDVHVNKIKGINSEVLQEVLQELSVKESSGTIVKTVEKETPVAGYLASYDVLQDDELLGVSINIPFDYKLTSGTVEDHKIKLVVSNSVNENTVVVDLGAYSTTEEMNTAISNAVSAAVTDLKDLINNTKKELEDKITAEETRASSEEAALEQSIKDEATRAETAEAKVKSDVEAELAEEVGNAKDREAIIANNLQDEVDRATSAETTLQTNIDNAKTELTNAINTKTTQELNDSTGKAEIFNEIDGGGARYTHSDGTVSFAGVNSGGKNGNTVVLYSYDQATNEGARLKGRNDGFYYFKGTNRTPVASDEIIVKDNLDAVNNTLTEAINTTATNAKSYTDSEIASEKDRALAAEKVNADNIKTEAKTARAAEKLNADNLATEISNRSTSEAQLKSDLETAISNEKTRAEKAESELTTSLGNEVTRATTTESNLNKAIEDEATRAKAVEAANAKSIGDEVTRALGVESGLDSRLTTAETDIDTIEEKIPNTATADNQLTDKAFVNSSIQAAAANYVTADIESSDAFATKAKLDAGPYYHAGEEYTPKKNDYAVVKNDENHNDDQCRYTFDGANWAYQYTINTTFTSAQQAAIDSGATSELVGQITTNKNNLAQEIADRKQAVSDEAGARANADNALNERVKAIEDDYLKAADKTELNNAINAEASRADTAEKTNAKAISDEETRAKGIEDGLRTDLTSEASTRKEKDDALDEKINNEVSRAEGIEGTPADLTTDTKDNLVAAINEVDAHIDTEVADRKAAIEALDADISSTNGKRVNVTIHQADGKLTEAVITEDDIAQASILEAHLKDKDNPHDVTKEQVGLDQVDNTSDADKPVSTAQQAALDKKVDKATGKSLLADTEIARLKDMATGATKVEASNDNGYIKINGTETNVYTIETKYSGTVNDTNDISIKKIKAPESIESSELDYGEEGQILTADGNGGTYWKDGYVKGTGITVTGNVLSTTYTTFDTATTDWEAVTDGAEEPTTLYYKAEKTVAGVTEASNPTLDVYIAPTDYANIDALNEAWSKVFSAETSEGKITLYASEQPESDITIQVKGY